MGTYGDDWKASLLADLGSKRRAMITELRDLDGVIRAAGGDPHDYQPDSPQPVGQSETQRAAPVPLSATRTRPRPNRQQRRKSGVGRYGRSVRQMTVEVVASEPRWWTTTEILNGLKEIVGPDLVDDKLADNMRTSLYTAKKEGEFEHDPELGYRARTLPAQSGAATAADTAAVAPDVRQEGGGADVPTPADGVFDHRSSA